MTSQIAIRSMVKNVRPVVLCLATLLGAGLVEVAAQTATDTGPSQTSGAPVITAKPEHVTVTGGTGSTEIHWDTRNG
jgi:hypothetical protein